MRIINVITIKRGTIDNVESFGVFEEQLSSEVSERAERQMTKKIKENEPEREFEDEDIEEILDNGYYKHFDFEITIIWSDI